MRFAAIIDGASWGDNRYRVVSRDRLDRRHKNLTAMVH